MKKQSTSYGWQRNASQSDALRAWLIQYEVFIIEKSSIRDESFTEVHDRYCQCPNLFYRSIQHIWLGNRSGSSVSVLYGFQHSHGACNVLETYLRFLFCMYSWEHSSSNFGAAWPSFFLSSFSTVRLHSLKYSSQRLNRCNHALGLVTNWSK